MTDPALEALIQQVEEADGACPINLLLPSGPLAGTAISSGHYQAAVAATRAATRPLYHASPEQIQIASAAALAAIGGHPAAEYIHLRDARGGLGLELDYVRIALAAVIGWSLG